MPNSGLFSEPTPRKLPFIAGGAEGEIDEPNPNESPETPPAPQFVPAEEFRSFQQTMQGSMSALTEALTGMRQTMDMSASRQRESDVPRPSDTQVTRAQYVQAIQEGDLATVERWDAQRDTAVAQRISQLESTGMDQFSQLNKRSEVVGLKYYDRFKKDIDAMVDALPPQIKMRPGVYQYAHNAIVGQHIDVLTSEAQEAALRKPTADAKPESLNGRSRSGREVGAQTTKMPSAYDLGGETAEAALAFRGMTEDDQARRMGYKDWPDYMLKTAEYR